MKKHLSKSKRLLLITGLVLLVLLGVRIALPEVLQWYVNGKLDEAPEYDGEVGDIDLSLIRGAYSIDNVALVKTDGNVPVPFFSATRVEFSLLWSALLDGAVVGEILLEQPMLNIVDSSDAANRQTGTEGNWLGILDDLFPLRIDQVLVHDGQLHFRNFDAEPVVDIYLSRLEGAARNLSNSEDLSESMVASIEASGLAMENSDISLNMKLDPSVQAPAFDLDLRLLGLPIITLDDFIKAYAPFDIEAGTLDLVTELAASDGQLEGYVKPLIQGLEVFRWKQDIEEDHDNPVRALWESLVGFVGELLQNQPRDQLATNIPVSGAINSPDTGVLVAIGNILKNAFIEAFQSNFENSISLQFDGEEDGVEGGEEEAQATPPDSERERP